MGRFMEFSWNVWWLLSTEKEAPREEQIKSGWALEDDIGGAGAGQPNAMVRERAATRVQGCHDRNVELSFTVSREVPGTPAWHDLHQTLRSAVARKLIEFCTFKRSRLAGRTDESEQAVMDARGWKISVFGS
jgi:hypothetical protein